MRTILTENVCLYYFMNNYIKLLYFDFKIKCIYKITIRLLVNTNQTKVYNILN